MLVLMSVLTLQIYGAFPKIPNGGGEKYVNVLIFSV